jgi:hypothetical protein
MTHGAVKTNPAPRLYECLGFRTTPDDERKLHAPRLSLLWVTSVGLRQSLERPQDP